MVLTGGSVALGNGEAVTEEIEAAFSFTVTSAGSWHTYELGSGGVQPVGNERLGLVQYTRQNVELWGAAQRVPGCEFREYTTGSGTTTSTVGELNGTLTMEWISNRFNRTYDHTPIYATTTDFGWMWGRGRFDEGGGDSFAFVWIADFDCNDDMTAATGKGFMHSVEENGRFGDMGNPIEARHHIMGTLDIVLSGGTYSGSFHLRNYPPNEVYDVGAINITGGVLQELTDDIAPQLTILNVTTDGPMNTPTDLEQQPGFEEIAWGKDPIKIVTASPRLGSNGTMDLTRNTLLYLNQSVDAENNTWVRIQGNPACVLHIDDTYNVTNNTEGGDGELYEILLLSLPYDMLKVQPLAPLFFDQAGYTFCPFGTVNGQPTAQIGTYMGAESFADAVIYIEATVGEADQFSIDVSYGLYAHPKVSSNSVTPNSGKPGDTMNVTITGKYFLRATNKTPDGTPMPNSGSVDFGPNITVINYKIDNATNPIDNSITATISIDGDAPIETRNVTVTSCFGYSNGNGVAPYKSGTLVDGFSIVAGNATLEGHISYLSRGTAPDPKWAQPFLVRIFQAGNLDNELWSGTASTDNNGVFTITGLSPGACDIGIKNCTCLSELNASVTLANNVTNVVDFGTTREGDSNGDDAVVILDFSILAGAFGSTPASGNWNPNCDFDRNGAVVILDFSLLAGNFGQAGPLQGH